MVKPNTCGKKRLLCIRWDVPGVMYYELLQPIETITKPTLWNQAQLKQLSRALKFKVNIPERHDKEILQHGNASLHVATIVKETLDEFR